ncbi:MAG TPA: hypothetical protein VHE34_21250 [Puia sp.]|uniref:hypothetical protein n=1 Tax=Puia sp. TaxID=2045100 RepID=UPI002C565610|nr:hypothetical protein [Puia sp.]HVU97771.1 hypothetical protein [Puia sp.]
MFLPTKQRTLLNYILEDFELPLPLDDRTLGAVYAFLFDVAAQHLSFADSALEDAVLTLKEIVESEQITTLEGIAAFFEEEDRAIDDYARDIMEEIQSAQHYASVQEDLLSEGDGDVMVAAVAAKPALSCYIVAADQFKKEEFIQAFGQMHPKLEYFFRRKLQYTFEQKHMIVADLMQETALRVLLKLRTEHYSHYPVESIIWFTAKSILYDWRNKNERQHRLTLEYRPDETIVQSFAEAYEAADLMQVIKRSGETGFKICLLHAKGYTFKEMVPIFEMTESSLRMRVQRFRKQLSNGMKKSLKDVCPSSKTENGPYCEYPLDFACE